MIKIVSVTLILSILFLNTVANASAERDFQAEIEEKEALIVANEAAKLDSEKNIDELQNDINLLQDQLNIYQDKINVLNNEINEKNTAISQCENEITALDKEIDNINTEIESLNTKIEYTTELLKQRLVATYMMGDFSMLEFLFSSSDFESFLTRMELIKRITDYDTELIKETENEVKKQKELEFSLEQKRKEQEQKKSDIETEKASILNNKKEIQNTYESIDNNKNKQEKKVNALVSYIASLERDTAAYEDAIRKIQKEEEEFNKQQNSSLSKGDGTINNDNNEGKYTVSSRGMICPLQYPNVKLSAWWGSYKGHKGIDYITAGATGNTYGKEIRAAASGKVIFAGKGGGNSWSYGNFVTIDHGNGVSTRYAHCSRIIVSSGEKVSQGQIIAYVGNTGNVYPAPTASNPHAGAHLHFEVILNGTRVNPEPWVPQVSH